MTNPLVTAFPGAVQPYATVKTALALALALPLKDAAAVAAFNALDLADDATPYPAVIYAGAVYDYASGDTTTAHDPDAGCITDASGRRYLRVAALKPDWIVLDKDLTAPPGSPAEGDAYYVATAATGDWAGRDGDYALYSARGWSFRAIEEGHILYVADEERYYRMPASGTLTAGLGDLALADASVESRHLAAPMGYVVQAAQTSPPGSPSDRVAYIVTATATGAWAGEENSIAEYDSGAAAWVFLTPRAGDTVWDVGAGYLKTYSGSAWVRALPAAPVASRQAIAVDAEVYSLGTLAETVEYTITTFTLSGLAGETVAIDLRRILLDVRKATGSGTLENGKVFVKKDSEVTNLAEIAWTTVGAYSTSYLNVLSVGATGGFALLVTDAIADTDPHDYHIGMYYEAVGSGIVSPRLTLDGFVEVLKSARITS